MVHARTHVDLNDPWIQVFIYHEIIAYHLKEAFLASDTTLTRFNAPNNDIFDFLLNSFPVLRSHKFTKGFHVPHSVIDSGTFMIFLNRVVGEMHELVMNVVKTELITAEPDITLLVKPYHRRIVVLNKDPLSYVKFLTIDQKRVLYILLNDKLTIFPKTVVGNIV